MRSCNFIADGHAVQDSGGTRPQVRLASAKGTPVSMRSDTDTDTDTVSDRGEPRRVASDIGTFDRVVGESGLAACWLASRRLAMDGETPLSDLSEVADAARACVPISKARVRMSETGSCRVELDDTVAGMSAHATADCGKSTKRPSTGA